MELLLMKTGQLFQINKEIITIGRSPNCDFFLPGKTISRVHATLVCSESGCILNDGCLKSDKFSANGLSVNGKQLKPGESRVLRNGDEVTLPPNYVFKFFDVRKKEKDSDPTLS